MRLLCQHPAVVADQRYLYESRMAQYWIHMLRVLADRPISSNPVCLKRFERAYTL